jgi:hypothetical protein
MSNETPREDQLGAMYYRYADAQAGTVAIVIKTTCNQRKWSLVHLRNQLGLGPADLRRLEKVQLPSADSFIADIRTIIAECHIYDWTAFTEVLGGPLLLSVYALSRLMTEMSSNRLTQERRSSRTRRRICNRWNISIATVNKTASKGGNYDSPHVFGMASLGIPSRDNTFDETTCI